MLDFYNISDDQPKPDYPEQIGLKFVGGLNETTFENLKTKKIIDSRFEFYNDFRWPTTLIFQIYERAKQKHFIADADVKELLKIIEPAINQKQGLIAYCD